MTSKEYVFTGWLTLTPPTNTIREGRLNLTKKEPALKPGERACRIRLAAPVALFKTPQLSASISFDGEGPEIDPVELAAKVENTLKGADFRVEVQPVTEGGE